MLFFSFKILHITLLPFIDSFSRISTPCLFVFLFDFAFHFILKRSIEIRERKCDLAGTRRNSLCNTVSKSRAHTHKVQLVNLQTRKLWWEEGNKFVKLRVTTRTLKQIKKKGLDATAKQYGVNLNKFSMSSGTAKPVAV